MDRRTLGLGLLLAAIVFYLAFSLSAPPAPSPVAQAPAAEEPLLLPEPNPPAPVPELDAVAAMRAKEQKAAEFLSTPSDRKDPLAPPEGLPDEGDR
ncbi:MAG TPA: hypothetical protein VEI97_03705 [bacterium]|nr:hypothetical protein [bacterium]